MAMPTFSELMAAIGFSAGWTVQKLRLWKRFAVRAAVSIAVFAGIGYSLRPAIDFASTLPAVNLSVIALMATTGFLLFGAAAFCYVLFAFLARLTQADPNIRRDIQYLAERVAHPTRILAPKPEDTGGSFTPYTEDRAFMQEQFDELVKGKILRPDDNLDDIVKNGEIDVEMLKARGVGIDA